MALKSMKDWYIWNLLEMKNVELDIFIPYCSLDLNNPKPLQIASIKTHRNALTTELLKIYRILRRVLFYFTDLQSVSLPGENYNNNA